jgi:hypothetical protein
MNAKRLSILVVVAIVLVGMAVLSKRRDRAPAPEQTGQPVFAGLPVNDVAKIVVRAPAHTATVSRVDGVWVSDDTYRYPADYSKVRQALLALADLKIGQVLQATPAQRQAMKMPAPGGTNAAAAAEVALFGADGRKLAALMLGAEHMRKSASDAGAGGEGGYPDGRYVSPDGGASIYLVTDALSSIGGEASAWLDAEIVNVNAGDVAEVSVGGAGLPDLHFKKSGNDMVVDGLATGEEMDSGKNYTIKSCLSYLRFTGVADPALSTAQLGLSTASVYRVVTDKGEIFTANVGGVTPDGNGRYLRVSAALKPEAVPAASAATNAVAAVGGATNAPAKAPDAAAQKARKELEEKTATLNARLKQWTYIVAKSQGDQMRILRGDVVKKKEPPKPEAGAAGAGAPPAGAPTGAVQAPSVPAALTNSATVK